MSVQALTLGQMIELWTSLSKSNPERVLRVLALPDLHSITQDGDTAPELFPILRVLTTMSGPADRNSLGKLWERYITDFGIVEALCKLVVEGNTLLQAVIPLYGEVSAHHLTEYVIEGP